MGMTPSRRTIEGYKLRHAAMDGQLLIYRCALCRRSTAFLAADVVSIWNPEMPVLIDAGECGGCGKSESMSVTVRLPTHADVGHLKIKRPAGVRKVQLWRDEWYG